MSSNRSENQALLEPLDILETLARTRKLLCSKENGGDLKVYNDNEPNEECMKALITAAEAQASTLHTNLTTKQRGISEKDLHRIIKLSSDLATFYNYARGLSFKQVFKTLDKILLHLFSKATIQLAKDCAPSLEHWSAWRASLPSDCRKAIGQLDELIMADLKELGGNPKSYQD